MAGWTPPSVGELQLLLQNYEIIRILGQGGMGAVYAARQLSLDRVVAIKILPSEALNHADGEDTVDRFKNEARSMARMNHPGIVGVYDFGETSKDQFYLVMEHVDGTDVAQMIVAQARLPDEHALSITVHVCDALHYAHSHGLIHRDIKPANILLNREGQVKIADFGLAKGTDAGSTGLTQSNITMGTPDFIAPEALIEGMTVDHRSDVYSVGVMLYNMLTGEVPRGAFKMPSAKTGSDPRFDAIILKAIQPEPDERYQSAQEMRRDLDVILAIPMAKMERTGRAAVPVQGVSSKVPSRPVSTGPKRVTTAQKPIPATGSRPVTRQPKIATGAQKPAHGTLPVHSAPSVVAEASPPQEPLQRVRRPVNSTVLFGGLAAAIVVAMGGVGWWMMAGGAHKDGPPTATVTPESGTAKTNPKDSQPKPPVRPPSPPSSVGGGVPSNITELREVPHDRWYKILNSRDSVMKQKNVEWKDGWVYCRSNSELLGFTELGGSHNVQNIALKSVVRPPAPGKEWMWTFREGPHGSYRLVVRADRLALDFDDRTAGTGRMVHLRDGSFPREIANASQWTLEATIRGDRFSVSLNGREIFSQDKLRLLESGLCWLRTGSSGTSGNLIVKDASFKILDDTVESPVVGDGSSPPGGEVTFKNHRYRFISDKLRWNEAKARAESIGGHLATITGQEENEWISSTFIKLLPEGLGLWVGGTNAGTPSSWRWITGESFSFTKWASGEPNNNRDESALMFSHNDAGEIGWLDLKEDGTGRKDRRGGFLVEWDDQKMSPGESTVLPGPGKWVDVTAAAANSAAPFKSATFGDVAGRMRFQGGEGAQLHLRVKLPRFYRAMRTRDRLLIEVFDSQANKVLRQLAAFDHLPALAESAAHEMVFAARGDILAVWIDGKYHGSVKDAELKSGAAGYHLPAGVQLKSLEFGDLGSGSAAAPPAKPVAPVDKAASSSPPPAETEFEKRLAQIEAQFKTAYDRSIGKPHEASLLEFNAQYAAALDRDLAAATKDGRLEDAVKLRGEKQRLAGRQPLPPAEADSSLSGPLKLLRGTYRSSLSKMEAERDKQAQPYYDHYDQLLEAYQKELTQQQKYDDAIKVKSLRVDLAAQRSKG